MISISDISTCLRLSLSLLGQAKVFGRNRGQFTHGIQSVSVWRLRRSYLHWTTFRPFDLRFLNLLLGIKTVALRGAYLATRYDCDSNHRKSRSTHELSSEKSTVDFLGFDFLQVRYLAFDDRRG